MSKGFLARWSRLKGESRRVPRESSQEPAKISADELASLPRVEDITADTDIKGFLRPGVPAELRNAALRKAWMVDPAIRDFEGHARDYAYDWNTRGGVPGNGPIDPGDEKLAEAGDKIS